MAKRAGTTSKVANAIRPMPPILIDPNKVKEWGVLWRGVAGSNKTKKPERFDRKQGMDFGLLFDRAFASSLAEMLGGISVVEPVNDALLPPPNTPNCVEIGKTRIVGGIRPQNYDAAYRPDGPRIVYDSKTLNDRLSIGKNWQNMVNDLATEASTVHTSAPSRS